MAYTSIMNLELVVEVHVDNLNLEDEFTEHNLMNVFKERTSSLQTVDLLTENQRVTGRDRVTLKHKLIPGCTAPSGLPGIDLWIEAALEANQTWRVPWRWNQQTLNQVELLFLFFGPAFRNVLITPLKCKQSFREYIHSVINPSKYPPE